MELVVLVAGIAFACFTVYILIAMVKLNCNQQRKIRINNESKKITDSLSKDLIKIKEEFSFFILNNLYFKTKNGFVWFDLNKNKIKPYHFYGAIIINKTNDGHKVLPLYHPNPDTESMMYSYLFIICEAYCLLRNSSISNVSSFSYPSIQEVSYTYIEHSVLKQHCVRMLDSIPVIIDNLYERGFYTEDPTELIELLNSMLERIDRIEKLIKAVGDEKLIQTHIGGGGLANINGFVSRLMEHIDNKPQDEQEVITKILGGCLGC